MTNSQLIRQRIEINAPGVPVEEVYARIADAVAQDQDNVTAPDISTRYYLKVLKSRAAPIAISISVTDQRLPVLNDLWNRVKRFFHELTVAYVNQMGALQSGFNQGLLEIVETQMSDLLDLQKEVQRLRTRVEQLEQERVETRSKPEDSL